MVLPPGTFAFSVMVAQLIAAGFFHAAKSKGKGGDELNASRCQTLELLVMASTFWVWAIANTIANPAGPYLGFITFLLVNDARGLA